MNLENCVYVSKEGGGGVIAAFKKKNTGSRIMRYQPTLARRIPITGGSWIIFENFKHFI